MSSFTSWEVGRRAGAATAVIVLVFTVLSAAFFRAQIVDHERFELESSNNRLRPLPLPAPRGDILDRNGLAIAENVPGYAIKLLTQHEDSLRVMVDRLAAFLPEMEIDTAVVMRRWKIAKHEPVLVFDSNDPRVVFKIEEHRTALPGVVVQQAPRRNYSLGAGVGHLVGYVQEVSRTDLDSNRYPGAVSGDLVGKLGIELEYDSLLRGRPGIRYVEVTSRGRAIREQTVSNAVRPIAGRALATTIDLPLQRFVDSMWRQDLPDMRGALVAMTPQGAILAYYSYPAYDPNVFIETYRENRDNPAIPLYNRVIQGRYPPASPFKLATAAMGLRRKLVTMNTRMRLGCNGGMQFGSRYFRCWKREGHGSLTLTGAIAASCDVYFYQLGLMLGEKAIFEDGVRFGMADRSGIDLRPETRPAYPRSLESYVNSRGASRWARGEILNLSIGQGENAQTLINMTAFYAALAGDGIKRAPFIVQGAQGKETHNLDLTGPELQGLRDAMLAVVQGGTAAASGGREFNVAGKTGTGQMTSQADIAWFLSFAPVENPKIVVGIVVEEGLHGSSIAKYAVRTIGRFLIGPDTMALRRADAILEDEPLLGQVGGVDTTPPIPLPPPATPRPDAPPTRPR
ncbi:MAG: penicillin-binding protein 2 [Gemmatimonadales bacterium]|nr:penicillin-binding protein 2 [Gemmatimonadales bacterium]